MLIDQIRTDSLAARKASDKLKASILVTLGSEATMVGKNDGGREPTDAEVTAVLKKFLKGIDEVLKFSPDNTAAQVEKTIIQSYLPKQLSDDEIRAEMIATGLVVEMKNTGKFVKELNDKFPGQVDGAAVSRIIKTFVTA